ncbi:cutinase family protein [Candidatus Mycobacterium wuenschmannii]|uniref:Cutinase family protein n=1 Tax=Candidatus Mycobacterium wuenschmannii TaxID=3027808 RepID=A0ABY8VVF9_9MYCO|nr:cutinase family protein [Candidatus Mycobacterium wuenschmannii]WIM87630.1 cutinase family protein [Candidatus Mycobacterium wuenschmannii]
MRSSLIRLAAVASFAAGLLAAPALAPRSVTSLPVASAACPGVEVVFARGREEPPGLGAVGDALVNSLRAKTHMSVGAYGVNYPANIDVESGANDMGAHVQSMASSCPDTREVLGGYSLGAEVADVATAAHIPPGVDRHVAAVALFGNGTHNVAPAFAGRTIDQCAQGDPICKPSIHDIHWSSHLQSSYIDSGLVDQAANFVAGKV